MTQSGTFQVERRRAPVPPRRRDAGARGRTPRFTPADIVAAIQRWHALYDAAPISADWEVSRARRQGHEWRVERFQAGDWPSTRMVRKQFGTWGDAIAAAGLPRPFSPSRKPRLTGPEEVLRAIRAWTLRYGEPPTQADWDPVRARALHQEWRIQRYRDGDWPSLSTVRARFETLTGAVAAAALDAAVPGETMAGRALRRDRNRRALFDHVMSAEPTVGPDLLATALRGIAVARRNEDTHALRVHLVSLSRAALDWAEALEDRR
jgi:hypothetical protein